MNSQSIGRGDLTPPGREFCDFVSQRMVNGAVPKRRFDPVDMPRHALPWICIFDAADAGRFTCRLFGTALVRHYGREMTGRSLWDIVTGESLEELRQRYMGAIRSRRCDLSRVEATFEHNQQMSYQRLIVPLSRPDDSIGWVACYIGLLRLPDRRSVLDLAAAANRTVANRTAHEPWLMEA